MFEQNQYRQKSRVTQSLRLITKDAKNFCNHELVLESQHQGKNYIRYH